MQIDDQDTQPLSIIRFGNVFTATSHERFRRLKQVSDTTGVRFLFVYLIDQRTNNQTYGCAALNGKRSQWSH